MELCIGVRLRVFHPCKLSASYTRQVKSIRHWRYEYLAAILCRRTCFSPVAEGENKCFWGVRGVTDGLVVRTSRSVGLVLTDTKDLFSLARRGCSHC